MQGVLAQLTDCSRLPIMNLTDKNEPATARFFDFDTLFDTLSA